MNKRILAALAAVLIVGLSACAKAPATQELPAQIAQTETSEPEQWEQPEQPDQVPAQEEDSNHEIEIMPDGQQPVDNSDWSWLDEPATVQMDLEEIVSCTYTLPHLTLHSEEASDTANTVFDDLAQTILSYAQQTVYPAAQEKQAIGYVNGGYSISAQDGTLVVSYTLSISYSTESGDQQFQHAYTIDLGTGELLKEE